MLVVSHDFPPVRSPQSIRAEAFTRHLAREVHQVVVITRTRHPGFAEPSFPDNVHIVRASSGWLEAQIDRLVARRRPTEVRTSVVPEANRVNISPATLNWKGRTIARLRHVVDLLCFPDGRALWVPDAIRRLNDELTRRRPDAALVMHEPAASLLVGRQLTRLGVPWVADLADPVLAPYTPWHWRGRAARLEAEAFREAAVVSVTNSATAELMASRHHVRVADIAVLPQGFTPQPLAPLLAGERLRLVYTGRFYPFRDPAALLAAVVATPGVQLVIAGPEMPRAVVDAAQRHPDSVQLVGEMGHHDSLLLQLSADVLVSVGNAGTAQAPGKVQEYLGAGRPLLHLFHDASDPASAIVLENRRGLAVPARVGETAAAIRELLALKRSGELAARFDLGADSVSHFSWHAIAGRMTALLASASTRSG